MPEAYRIVALPSVRVISPGAKITYKLERRDSNAKPVDQLRCVWLCINDPASVSFIRPKRAMGPMGPAEWRDAQWEFAGRHRIVCRVDDGGKTTDYSYDQEVAKLPAVLATGPALPLERRDPEAALDGVSRHIELVHAMARAEPPIGELLARHQEQLAEAEEYRDKLTERLRTTRGARRYPVRAQHFSIEAQKWLTLDVFAAEAGGRWWIVDWTNAAVRGLTGEYDGSGGSPEAALRHALDTWDEDNRYPDGVLRYAIANVPGCPTIHGQFETDGSSFWDSIASFFTWVGIGAAATAAAIMFLSPVPGPQAVSVAIWTSIFSSTAAATINIGQRAAEGFSSWRANAFDVLTIVGNMFGVAGLIWTRGAALTMQLGPNVLKAVLIGQVTTDGVQGVLMGIEHVEQMDRIRRDPSLTPKEKVDRILELCHSLALNGLLVYINVKGTKADLDNLNLKPKHLDGEAPADTLKRLGDPNEHLDLTKKKPVAEGHTADGDHTTTVHLDDEAQPLQAGGRARAPSRPSADEGSAYLPDGKPIPAEPLGTVHHGMDSSQMENLDRYLREGLPPRRHNRSLLDHVLQHEDQHGIDTAFRGTTSEPILSPEQGAAIWAGHGGFVLRIQKAKGWNPEKALLGRVPRPDGTFGNIPSGVRGEVELTIEARVPASQIDGYYLVREVNGRLRLTWHPNPYLGKPAP